MPFSPAPGTFQKYRFESSLKMFQVGLPRDVLAPPCPYSQKHTNFHLQSLLQLNATIVTLQKSEITHARAKLWRKQRKNYIAVASIGLIQVGLAR